MFDKYRVTVLTLSVLLLLSLPLFGQQSYVTRFDVYGGYGFLDSPKVNLFEHGFRSEERRVGKECSSRWSPYH